MDIRLGRQLGATVRSRLVLTSKPVLAFRPLRLLPGQQTTGCCPPALQQRQSAAQAQAGSYGQPAAISINSEAAAVPEPDTPVPAAAAAPPPATDAHSSQAAAAVSAAGQAAAAAVAAAGVEQPQPQLNQQQQPEQQQAQQPAKKKVSNFINRVIFGIILGFGGAAVVAKGSLLYLCATMFVVYHATQEFYGFLTSSGISQGMPPPSPFVSVATTALCLSITVFTYFRCARGLRQLSSSLADGQQHTAFAAETAEYDMVCPAGSPVIAAPAGPGSCTPCGRLLHHPLTMPPALCVHVCLCAATAGVVQPCQQQRSACWC